MAHRLIEQMGAAPPKEQIQGIGDEASQQARQGARAVHALCKKEMPQDKVGSYPILSRGISVDSSDASLPITAQVSRRADKEQRQYQTCRSAMSNHGRHVPIHRGNLSPPQGMCRSVRPLQKERQVLPAQPMETAKEKEDEEAERQILAIIQREKDKSFWRRLNYALGKPRGGACFKVQVEQAEGTVEEICGKEDLHEAIWENIHRKRFYLAEDAPMCSGPLRGLFGYNSVTPIAKAILEGTYQYPPDFDEATKEILQECVLICICVPKNSVTTTITPEDWTNHWRRAREETSSSTSG